MSAGAVVWVTGLPASGKSTLARALVVDLRGAGEVALHLDSDDLRGFVAAGYDDASRDRLYRLLGHLAALGAEAGVVVVVSATAHRRAWRDDVRARTARFIEVLMDVDARTCAARDPKGLWRAAAAGELASLPGAGVAFERPLAPEVVLDAATAVEVGVAIVRRALDVAGA